MCLYFLDEMSLAAPWQVNLSRLKIKIRLFIDQELTHCKFYLIISRTPAMLICYKNLHSLVTKTHLVFELNLENLDLKIAVQFCIYLAFHKLLFRLHVKNTPY